MGVGEVNLVQGSIGIVGEWEYLRYVESVGNVYWNVNLM